MKIHALVSVRDESDIIAQSIIHMLSWADMVHVFDTGSTDGTWDVILDLSAKDRRIATLRRDSVYYSDTHVRAWLFNEARPLMEDGDWFVRGDVDEFHVMPVRKFIETRMRKHETAAWHQIFDFRFTQSDANAWESGQESLRDRARPIEARRRWFTLSACSEPRLCRYRSTMKWPPTTSFPHHAGFVAESRLPIRHYPNRDPAQMDRRCKLRSFMLSTPRNRENWGRPDLHHWSRPDWREFVTPDDLPGLTHWMPGSQLPDVQHATHLAGPAKRIIQRTLHACMLPLMDRLHSPWPVASYPQRMAAEDSDELDRFLAEQVSTPPISALRR